MKLIVAYSGGFKDQFVRFEDYASKSGEFEVSSVDLDLKYVNTPFNESNRFGYYLFKPEIIKSYMEGLSEGEIFIYMDINDLPLEGLKGHVLDVFDDPKIDVLTVSTNYRNSTYCHSEYYCKLSLLDKIRSNLTLQVEAGFIAIRKSLNSQIFISEWESRTNSIRMLNELYRSSTSRHDQEAFSYTMLNYNFVRVENWFLNKLGFKGVRNYVNFEVNRF